MGHLSRERTIVDNEPQRPSKCVTCNVSIVSTLESEEHNNKPAESVGFGCLSLRTRQILTWRTSLNWPTMPYLLPNVIDSTDRPEWLNFTHAGRDLTAQETLDLALIVFQQLTSWVSTPWANPCDMQPVNGDAAIRLALTCHQPMPSVLTLIIALKELMLLILSWGGKEVKYDFGVGTNYTHGAALGTFEIIELVTTE